MSSPTSSGNIVDLFGPTAASAVPANAKASDDLLQLGNPFADMFGAPAPPVQPQIGMIFHQKIINKRHVTHLLTFKFFIVAPAPQSNAFVSDSNFGAVFGVTEPVGKMKIHQIEKKNQQHQFDMDFIFFIFDAIPLTKFIHMHTLLKTLQTGVHCTDKTNLKFIRFQFHV